MFHSLKGMSATMEFKKMEKLTHKLEDLLYEIREGNIITDKNKISLLLTGYTFLANMFEMIEDSGSEKYFNDEQLNKILAKIDKVLENVKKEILIETVTFEKFSITEVEYTNIKTTITEDENIFKMKILIDENSPMKSVRAFMLINNLDHNGDILDLFPSLADVQSGEIDIEAVYALVKTKESKKKLLDLIKSVSDIKSASLINATDFSSLSEFEEEFEFVEESPLNEETFEEDEFSKELMLEFKSKLNDILPALNSFVDSGEKESLVYSLDKFLAIFETIEMFYSDTLSVLSRDVLAWSEELFEKEEITDQDKNIMSDFIDILIDIAKDDEIIIDDELKDKISQIENSMTDDDFDLEVVDNIEKRGKLEKKEKNTEYVRISLNKADSLMGILEEILVSESQIENHIIDNYTTDIFLNSILSKILKLTKEAQNISIDFRMIPMTLVFKKMKMTAMDAIKKLNKNIKLEIKGENTEIDRAVGNNILDPLLHLIKNSISHGIEESEDERIALGKTAEGNINIFAFSVKGYVYIEISDDGKGIDPELVYSKAKEKGLIDLKKEYSREDKINLIFMPGFSTAEVIDNIKGRGVGMDVVKTELKNMRGNIEIETEVGVGTKFRVKIPRNTTALNGTMVELGNSTYIIPTMHIKEIFEYSEDKNISIRGKNRMIKLRGNIIPLINQDRYFNQNKNKEREKIVLVLEVNQKIKALLVNKVLGRAEFVVKPLDDYFKSMNHFYGASILSSGEVAIILDIVNMFVHEDSNGLIKK